MRKKHALVLGCGRSGTSILGEFFLALSTFSYFSEIGMDEVMKMTTDGSLAFKVPRSSDRYPPEAGLSFELSTMLEKLQNDVQIFWIVRHPLDTICSLKVGISKNWGHHPRPRDWQEWRDRPLLAQCAHHWKYINEVGFQKIKKHAILLYFEDMISDATATASTILDHVKAEETVDSTTVKNWINRIQNSNNKDFVEAETSRPYSRNDHKNRVGRWKENMTEAEAAFTWEMVQTTAIKFGYHLP